MSEAIRLNKKNTAVKDNKIISNSSVCDGFIPDIAELKDLADYITETVNLNLNICDNYQELKNASDDKSTNKNILNLIKIDNFDGGNSLSEENDIKLFTVENDNIFEDKNMTLTVIDSDLFADTNIQASEHTNYVEHFKIDSDQIKVNQMISKNDVIEPISYPKLDISEPVSSKLINDKVLNTELNNPGKLFAVTNNEQDREDQKMPLTKQQLKTLSYNDILENMISYIEEFYNLSCTSEQHELYNLIINYERCRKCWLTTEAEVIDLKNEVKVIQGLCWVIKQKMETIYGYCADNINVNGNIVYDIANFDEAMYSRLRKNREKLSALLSGDYTIYAYEASLARLQIVSYFEDLYSNNSLLNSCTSAHPIQFVLQHHPYDAQQIKKLKDCITVLFNFLRQPENADFVFREDINKWITSLILTLLRLASLEDHLFILNHILRCPKKKDDFMHFFVQSYIPNIDYECTNRLDDTFLNYFVTSLACILSPIRFREEMLSALKINFISINDSIDKSHTNDQLSSNWTVLDSDGEVENEEMQKNQWIHSDQIISLLNQFPICKIFAFIFKIDENSTEYGIKARDISNSFCLKFIAFISKLIGLHLKGFKLYQFNQYIRLRRYLQQSILNILIYASGYIEKVKSILVDDHRQISLEFDCLIIRIMEKLLRYNKLEAYQLISSIPLVCVSNWALWKILALICDLKIRINDDLSICLDLFNDEENINNFIEQLSLNESNYDFSFLLTSLMNIIGYKKVNLDEKMIKFVSSLIFKICFLNVKTREVNSKHGRTILKDICIQHKFIFSHLLMLCTHNLDKLGKVAYYLFTGLPIYYWNINGQEFKKLSHWLIYSPNSSPEFLLAAIIIDQLNWGLQDNGMTFLPIAHHKYTAQTLMQVYAIKFLNKKLDRNMALIDYNISLTEPELCQWVWCQLMKLRLHPFSLRSKISFTNKSNDIAPNAPPIETENELIDENENLLTYNALSSLENVTEDITSGSLVDLYLSIVITKVGTCVDKFLNNGMLMLSKLIEAECYLPALHVLFLITPLYFYSSEWLANQTEFTKCLLTLARANLPFEGKNNIPSSALEKNNFSKSNLKKIDSCFVAMILNQFQVIDDQQQIIACRFWFKIISSLETWWKETNLIMIVDILLEISFQKMGHEMFQEMCLLFKSSYQRAFFADRKTGVLNWVSSFVVNVNATDVISPLPLDLSVGIYPWTTYLLIFLDSNDTKIQSVWDEFIVSLPEINKDKIIFHFEKICHAKNFSDFKYGQLGIFQLTDLIIQTPFNHPIYPLLWYRFLRIFLVQKLPNCDDSWQINVICNISSLSYLPNENLLYKLRKRLSEYLKYLNEICVSDQICAANYCGFIHKFSTILNAPLKKNASQNIQRICESFDIIIRSDINSWLKLLKSNCQTWNTNIELYNISLFSQKIPLIEKVDQSILYLVKSLKSSKIIQPPNIDIIRNLNLSIPNFSQGIPVDYINYIKQNMNIICQYATDYNRKCEFLHDMDIKILQLITNIYTNELDKTEITVPCRNFLKPLHVCNGPAHLVHKHQSARWHKSVDTQIASCVSALEQINWTCIRDIEKITFAVISVKNNIEKLVERAGFRDGLYEHINMIGIEIFYLCLSVVSKETILCQMTKNLLEYYLNILGDKFIDGNPSQCKIILSYLLNEKSSIFSELLLSHFNPNVCFSEFVDLYSVVLGLMSTHDVDTAYLYLDRFLVYDWLEYANPQMELIIKLIDVICQKFITFGCDIKEIYFKLLNLNIENLLCILKHHDMLYLDQVIKKIIEISCYHRLHTSIWESILSAIGCPFTSVFCEESEVNDFLLVTAHWMTDKKSLEYSMPMLHCHITKILDILHFLTNYFLSITISNDCNSNIFDIWINYVPYLANMFQHLGFNLCKRAVLDSTNFEKDSCQIFNTFLTLYSSWINSEHFAKCIDNIQIKILKKMLHSWMTCVNSLTTNYTEKLQPFDKNTPLSLIWTYYFDMIVFNNDLKSDMHQIFNMYIYSLPWKMFNPTLSHIDQMIEICNRRNYLCIEFLGAVFSELNWRYIINYYSNYLSFQDVSNLHFNLLKIFLNLSLVPEVIENSKLSSVMLLEDVFMWHIVDPHSIQILLEEHALAGPCIAVLMDRTSSHAQIIRFLKMVTRYERIQNESVYSSVEYILWHAYVEMLCVWIRRCTFFESLDFNVLGLFVSNLLSNVEDLVNSVENYYPQICRNLATDLCGQFTSLICDTNLAYQSSMITIIIEWLNSSAASVLIRPFISACCKNLESPYIIIHVLETCLDVHFSIDVSKTAIYGWGDILDYAYIEYNELLAMECISKNLTLTLYLLAIKQLPNNMIEQMFLNNHRVEAKTDMELKNMFQVNLNSSIDAISDRLYPDISERIITNSAGNGKDNFKLSSKIFMLILGWCELIKPNADTEAKLLLLFDLILSLALYIINFCADINMESNTSEDSGRDECVLVALQRFLNSINKLTQENGGSSVLAVIGIRGKSSLSTRFLLVCNCLAAILSSCLDNFQISTSKRKQSSSIYISQLKSMAKHKQYASIIDGTLSTLKNNSLSLNEVVNKLSDIVHQLYPDCHYLAILAKGLNDGCMF